MGWQFINLTPSILSSLLVNAINIIPWSPLSVIKYFRPGFNESAVFKTTKSAYVIEVYKDPVASKAELSGFHLYVTSSSVTNASVPSFLISSERLAKSANVATCVITLYLIIILLLYYSIVEKGTTDRSSINVNPAIELVISMLNGYLPIELENIFIASRFPYELIEVDAGSKLSL